MSQWGNAETPAGEALCWLVGCIILSQRCACPQCWMLPRPTGAGAGRAVTPARRAGAHGAPRVVLTEGERSRQKLFHIRCFGVSGPASPCLLVFPKYCCSRLALSSCVCAPRSEGQLSAPLWGWGGPSADAHAGGPWQSLACPPIPGATGSAFPSLCSLSLRTLAPKRCWQASRPEQSPPVGETLSRSAHTPGCGG